jgi:hypothetical protein
MTGGNVYLSGDKAAAQSLIPEAQQCVAIVRAMRDALELDELERVFSLNGGTCRVVLGKYSEQLYIQPDPPEPPEEEEPEEEIDLGDAPILYHKLAMPWRPEGMIFTPVTESQPKGLGLPMRDVDSGDIKREIDPGNPNELGPIEYTEGGTLPQVLMNRFANNKYMDNLLYVNGLPPEISLAQPSRSYRLSEKYELDDNDEVKSFPSANQQIYFSTTPIFGHPHSWGEATDSDDPAEHFDLNDMSIMPELAGGLFAVRGILEADAPNGGLVEIQTKTTQELPASALSEPEQAEWYSHRPEEMLYPSATKEYVFREHNRLRREVGVGDFRRPLRGDGEIGDYGVFMMGEHNDPRYAGHSHYDWMPGFRTAGGRHASFSGQGIRNRYADNTVENLVTFSLLFEDSADISTEKELAEYMVDLWRNSPGHYAGIIADQWDFDRETGYLDAWSDKSTSFDLYGACLNVGAAPRYAGLGSFFDVNAPDAPNGQLWNENPYVPPVPDGLPGIVTYSVTFDQRATWLPTPHITREIDAFGVGGVGFFSGGNSIAPDPNIGLYTRYFAVDNQVHWTPPNQGGVFYTLYSQNEPPYPYAWWETDRFFAIAGAHPYERDLIRVDAEGNETEFKQTWMRVAYWESDFIYQKVDDLLTGRAQNQNNFSAGTYITLKIATFPLTVPETHVLPWRDPIGDGIEWAIEDEFTWSEPDYFAMYDPTVEFTSDGNKLCFQVYKMGEPVNTDHYESNLSIFFQDYSDLVINGRSPYDPIETKRSTGWFRPAVPVTVEWTPDFGFEEEEPQEPIVAVVDARSDDIDMGENDGRFSLQVNHYETSVQGSYRIWPHYNDSDELQHVEAVVDYYSIQRRFAQFTYWHIKEGYYPPPEGAEPHADHLWCQLKLVFPSGKEWVYHQANRTVPEPPPAQAVGDIPPTPFYDMHTPHPDSPYTEGGTFNRHLLHIDIHREDVIYLESSPVMYRWKLFYDVLQIDNIYDITLQDQKIVRDWSEEDELVVMWEKLHTPPVDYEWVHGDYYGGATEFWSRSPGRWDQDIATDNFVRPWLVSGHCRTFYEGHVTSRVDITDFTSSAGLGRFTDAKLFHYDAFLKVNAHEVSRNFPSGMARYEEYALDPYDNIAYYLGRGVPENYGVSGVPNRWQNRLSVADQPVIFATYRTGCASPASIVPSYMDVSNCVVRVLRYKDRFLIRIWIDDMPLVGGKPENVPYTSNDNIPDYTYPPYRPDPSGEPLLLIDSNFDLDEAAGMEGVKDIYPCGVLY